MDETHPLPPAAEISSQAEFKNRPHQTHRAAWTSHKSNTKPHHAASKGLSRHRRSLPSLTHLGQKTPSRRSRFIDLPLASVTIKSNRRSVDQHANARVQAAYNLLRGFDAAAQNFLFLGRCPKSQNRLACQIYHGVQA